MVWHSCNLECGHSTVLAGLSKCRHWTGTRYAYGALGVEMVKSSELLTDARVPEAVAPVRQIVAVANSSFARIYVYMLHYRQCKGQSGPWPSPDVVEPREIACSKPCA